MTERLVNPQTEPGEAALDSALRPQQLQEFVGQPRVRDQLDLVLTASRRRGRPADHVLLSGPPGLGKTTLAGIIATEMQAPFRITSGPALQHAGDLAALLTSLQPGEVLFLDEIHRTSRTAQELLYIAMEDFRVDIVVGKGPGATAVHWSWNHSRWWGRPPARDCCRGRCATVSASPPTWTSMTRPIWRPS